MVSGCWFHYAQALVKRLRKIGFTDSYNNHQETQTIFRALLALPLLPMADIRPAFDDVKSLLIDDSPRKVCYRNSSATSNVSGLRNLQSVHSDCPY